MKNLFELTHQEKNEIKCKIMKRMRTETPFAYYINNCVSIVGCPKRLGSFVCDLVMRIEVQTQGTLDIDIVGYYVNELFYDHNHISDRDFCEKIIDAIAPKEIAESMKPGIDRYTKDLPF